MVSPLWYGLLVVLGSSHAARILGIFPTPSISHQLPFQAVMKALALKGHQVTVLSPNPLKTSHPNYTDIDLSFTYDFFQKNVDPNTMWDLNPWQMFGLFTMMGAGICHAQLPSTVMQDFIKSNPKFDLVFIESLNYQCMYGLIHHVGSPPVIGILSMGVISMVNDATGNPNNPAYIPDSMWPFTDHMTFWERAKNMVFSIHSAYKSDQIFESQERLMRQYFGPDPPNVLETQKNFSLIMIGHHWSMSYPQPLLPNIIQLGFLHGQEPTPLPQDLADFLDGAKDGFVYFSLGSNVRSDKLPEHKRRMLLEAFAQLPQRVLWKWESDTLPGQPDNVKLGKWLPQQDILAHPNIRLFVTQGGLQSFQEATHHAVPMVAVPFIADQKHNAKKIATSGVGLELDINTATTETILATFKQVINNKIFRENMKRVSAITNDQPETPLERAVWWTEYVLRHNGAKHLRSAALDLTWYQYLLLDVIAVIVTAIFLSAFLIYLVLKKMCKIFANIISPKHKQKANNKLN